MPLISRSIRPLTRFWAPASGAMINRLRHADSTDLYKPRQPQTDFDHVFVRPEIEQQLIPVVKYLQDPTRYDQLNIAPQGVLLSGPPGTGKSALAEAMRDKRGWRLY